MKVWEIVLAAIAAAGGYGAIIVGVVKFCSNIIADRLEKKYELKLGKELEKYKTMLENKNFISKTRFETEFSIYRELSVAFFDMDARINVLIPPGLSSVLADEDKQKEVDKDNYAEAHNATVTAQNVLYQNLPFISESFISKYMELLDLSKRQLSVFSRRWNRSYLVKDKDVLDIADYERSTEIHNKLLKLNSEIREYLNSLEVIE